jgi:hypothetical protein
MRLRNSLLALCLSTGCAAFAKKSDYYDYRAAHTAHDERIRLVAMQRYVARHPSGRWYDEVQGERQQRDKEVFEAGKSDRAGLELYLAAFPDGAFAAQARSRLSAVAVIEQRKREEAQRAERLAVERKQRDAELARTWVTRFFGYWARTLLALQNWGSPIEQVARANPEFSKAFGRAPRPRCSADECVKYYESAYAVPVPGGTRLERSLRLILRLRMEHGQLVRAELLLPGWGFSRWQELEERRPVIDADPEARKQAVDWAIARVTPILDQLAADRQPVHGYTLAEIQKPAIGANGELVDTTAEDPAAPSNRIQGEAPATPEAEPDVAELVKPAAPEQAPDMELAPLQVGKDGRALSNPPGAAAPAPIAVEGPVLEMAPVTVPAAPGTPAAASPAPSATAAPAPAAVTAPPAPAVTQAFLAHQLRIVVFAAGADAKAPAYDGLVLERALDARTEKRTKRVAPSTTKPAEAPAGH